MNSLQLLAAVVASFGGLLNGYESGIINVVLSMDAFGVYFGYSTFDGEVQNKDMQPTTVDGKNGEAVYRKMNVDESKKASIQGTVASGFQIGAIVGGLLSSYMGDKLGRKVSIVIGALMFAIGGGLQGGTPVKSEWVVCIGRAISGFSAGIMGTICPTYISEVAPANIRGTLSSFYQLSTTVGIVAACIVNSIIWYCTNYKPDFTQKTEDISSFEWRCALLIQVGVGLALFLMVLFVPKSPRWLCQQDRDEEAANVLAKLYATTTSDAIVQDELKAIQEDVAASRAITTGTISELIGPVVRRRTFIVLLMQLFQQWTGINVIMYYQTEVYKKIGFDNIWSTIWLPIIGNSINCVSTFPGMWGIERFGRKSLLIVGSVLMAAAHILCGIFCSNGSSVFNWLAIVSIFVFIIAFASTWGPVPWVYQGEVFPLRVRVYGSAVGTVSNQVNNWIITKFTPYLLKWFDTKIFYIFAATTVVSFFYAKFYCIECKGLSLEEMDEKMAGGAGKA